MEGEGQPHGLLGLLASQVYGVNALRYCPRCVSEDRQCKGETYWRRTQQLPGVLLCPKHGVWLEHSDIRVPASSNRHLFWPAETCIPHDSLARQFNGSPTLVTLAQRAAEVLKRVSQAGNEKLRQERYILALAELNLATYSGQIRVEDLLSAFHDFLPNDLARQLGLNTEPEDWLLRLLRKPRTASHTLYHLIFQVFAHVELDDLELPIQPFGSGPWPCLNRVSDHYREHRIQTVDVSYTQNERVPIGQFACSCGFTYRRTGPDQHPDDIYRLDRMAEYGAVWNQALKESWLNPDLSLRGLSRKLGFDPITVKKQAANLELPQVRPGSRGGQIYQPSNTSQTQSIDLQQRAIYRKRWQQAKKSNPDASVKELRKVEPATYTWLYRHDRKWLHQHKPIQVRVQSRQQRVDWKARDLSLVVKLRRAAQRLKRRKPFVRISPTRLAREIGHATLLTRHLDKLPTCRQALLELTESREAFAVRRIKMVTNKLIKSRTRVSYSQLMRLCGLRAEMLQIPVVETAFEEAWQNLEGIGKVRAA